MVTVLKERGVFSAEDWSQALGAAGVAARKHGDVDDGSTYYDHVLAALEQLVREKGCCRASELRDMQDAWARAFAHTPHGQPVELDNFRSAEERRRS